MNNSHMPEEIITENWGAMVPTWSQPYVHGKIVKM
jgi:hypothetical protein